MADAAPTPPEGGAKITIDNGKLQVPDNPIVPFIEGDGIGPDIWQAAQLVMDSEEYDRWGSSIAAGALGSASRRKPTIRSSGVTNSRKTSSPSYSTPPGIYAASANSRSPFSSTTTPPSPPQKPSAR